MDHVYIRAAMKRGEVLSTYEGAQVVINGQRVQVKRVLVEVDDEEGPPLVTMTWAPSEVILEIDATPENIEDAKESGTKPALKSVDYMCEDHTYLGPSPCPYCKQSWSGL